MGLEIEMAYFFCELRLPTQGRHVSFLPSVRYPTYDSERVAQRSREVARIHRQKEKGFILGSTSAWPRKIEFAISVGTSSRG